MEGSIWERDSAAWRAGQEAKVDAVLLGFPSAEDKSEHAYSLTGLASVESGARQMGESIVSGDAEQFVLGLSEAAGGAGQFTLMIAGGASAGGRLAAPRTSPVLRNRIGQAIGPDGRFIVDPLRPPAPSITRPRIRASVREEVLSRAPRDAQGRLLDPNTFEPIEGSYHLGHRPGHEWWRIRDRAAAEGWTRQELVDYVNNPDLYQIELPANNLSHRYEMPR